MHAFEPIVKALMPLCKFCGIQCEKIFFDSQMYDGPTNLNLTIGHRTILQYQLAHSIYGFRNNNWFWTTFTKFVLEWTMTSFEFIIPSINTGPWWSFIAKYWIKLVDALLLSESTSKVVKNNHTKMFTIFWDEMSLLSYCKQHK